MTWTGRPDDRRPASQPETDREARHPPRLHQAGSLRRGRGPCPSARLRGHTGLPRARETARVLQYTYRREPRRRVLGEGRIHSRRPSGDQPRPPRPPDGRGHAHSPGSSGSPPHARRHPGDRRAFSRHFRLSHNLSRAALSLKAGGVGTYPRSNFVHVDIGPVRRW
ncbi:MAG: DUF882 domain-containing protein [Nitrospirae bacterium]|nr:DUF882 domain-containing protein [Nitrospirota bacterium]